MRVSDTVQPWRKMQTCEKDGTGRESLGLVHPRYKKLMEEYFGGAKTHREWVERVWCIRGTRS